MAEGLRRSKADVEYSVNSIERFLSFGAVQANCLRVGWTDEAISVAEKIVQIDGFNGFYDICDKEVPQGSRALINTLILEYANKPISERLKQRFSNDELLMWFYNNWKTQETQLLASRLKTLCDRHTQLSRFDTNKQYFEFPLLVHFYDISEVLAILRLRELVGLEPVSVEHPIMKTPIAKLRNIQIDSSVMSHEKVIAECLKYFSHAT